MASSSSSSSSSSSGDDPPPADPLPADPGDARPEGEPLRVGRDMETSEYVEFWLQYDKEKDPGYVLTNPKKRNGTIFGYAYVMRRSSGAACHDETGRRICKKNHLCSEWPCPSDVRLQDGSVDYSRWRGLLAPWHLLHCEHGWPAEGGALAAAGAPLDPAGLAAEETGAAEEAPAPAEEAPAEEAPAEAPLAAGPEALAEAGVAVKAALAESEARAAVSAHEAAPVPFPRPAPLPVRDIAEPVLAGSEVTASAPPAQTSAAPSIAPPAPARTDSQQGLRCFETLMRLSRSIRGTLEHPRPWIGYSAFVTFALLRNMRVYVWEGHSRVDICAQMLPEWKVAELTRKPEADAIACCAVPRDSGPPEWAPVSSQYPLHKCSHFIAGVFTDFVETDADPATIDGFYSAHGVYVVSTVADGDCGLDCMLRMAGEVSTTESRRRLRQDSFVVGSAVEVCCHVFPFSGVPVHLPPLIVSPLPATPPSRPPRSPLRRSRTTWCSGFV